MNPIIEQLFENAAVKGYGTCSTFGGERDLGVAPNEGLALAVIEDITTTSSPLNGLWLPHQPDGTSGMARRLNQWAFYCACRWDYQQTPISVLRRSYVVVAAQPQGRVCVCRPVDWGPNLRTGRVIDLSPGAAGYLGVATNDKVAYALLTTV